MSRAVLAFAVAAGLVAGPAQPSSAGNDDSITAPDTRGDVGRSSSLVLDARGNPVVAYRDATNNVLKLLHCNDPLCAGSGESITTPDTGDDVGWWASLALDRAGNPVVSYYDLTNGDLKVLRCDDPDCAGSGESITAPHTAGDVGQYTSLVLDAAGNPVVSYYDATGGNLRVLRCDDPRCAGSGESITAPDTAGDVGLYTSLALNGAGNPVVSYHDAGNGDLKVLHCNDPRCAGTGESITTPDAGGIVGRYTSLVLDAAGNPVVAYFDETNLDLMLLRCNDPRCAGTGESITTLDSGGHVGQYASLALDGSGNPVVAYHDVTNLDLKLLRCNDPRCAGSGESVLTPDSAGSVGQYVSLQLSSDDEPVVSYYRETSGDLRLLRCNDRACASDPDDIFEDDNFSVFEADIEQLARSGITRGCNPPANTRFCPDDPVTREQLAAFLTRALDLPAAPERFSDVSSSNVFASDIGALAVSRITRGCNPPANTRFCPRDVVTREQLAAFLTRTLDLPAAPERFSDVSSSNVFASDIGALAASRITRGCNPPANTRFCPSAQLTRGQLAAFFVRAGLAD